MQSLSPFIDEILLKPPRELSLRKWRYRYDGAELSCQSLVEPIKVFVPPVDLDVAEGGSDGVQHEALHPSELGALGWVSNLAGVRLS